MEGWGGDYGNHARSELDAAVDRANRQMDQIEAGREISAGPCSSCRWAYNKDPICSFETDLVCAHPLVSSSDFDPTRHDLARSYVMRSSARQWGGVCGPEGKLFQRRRIWEYWQTWLAAFVVAWVTFLWWIF